MYYDTDAIQQWNRDRRHQMIRSCEHSRADEAPLRVLVGQLMKRLGNHFVRWGSYLQTAVDLR